jgi:hypothetical protein
MAGAIAAEKCVSRRLFAANLMKRCAASDGISLRELALGVEWPRQSPAVLRGLRSYCRTAGSQRR